jgi:hypothetical protein
VLVAGWPVFYERLAEKREESDIDPLPELERAALLEPSNPARWLRMASAAEWNGDPALAGECLRRAAKLSRLYQPRYLLAQHYFRRQNAPAFFAWAQQAFQMAYGDVSALLDLCRRMQPDGESFARQALASPLPVRRQFLTFLLNRRETGAAAGLARALSEIAGAADLPALFNFCNLSLDAGDAASAAAVWNVLCRRGLAPYAPLIPDNGVSVTNADFRRPALATAFDWHVEPPAGIRIAQVTGEWRAVFSGEEPEACVLAWQYVPLVPNRRYHIQIDAAPLEESSVEGIGWSLFDRADDGAWREWIPGRQPEFSAPSALVRLALTYRRPYGSPRLAGSVAIRGVRLEQAP